MIEMLKKILGIKPAADYGELVKNGAVILDVRTKEEYAGGHIKGAVNISLQSLQSNLSKLKKDKTIITCCASGMRSAYAKNILAANGFYSVFNGGGWRSLQNKIS